MGLFKLVCTAAAIWLVLHAWHDRTSIQVIVVPASLADDGTYRAMPHFRPTKKDI